MIDGNETFHWDQLARRQKIWIVGGAVLLIALVGYGLIDRWRLNSEIRQFEQAATAAKRDAQAALAARLEITKQKVALEKKVSETEAKIDGKRKEELEAKARSADARLEYQRALRERRTDNPTAEQLCTELAALGYPC